MRNLPRAALAVLVSVLACAAVHAEPGFRYVVGSITVTDLGTLGGHDSQAYDINDAGNIVGWAQTGTYARHAFYLNAGSMRDIGVANATSTAYGINASSAVVGSWRKDGATNAFRWNASGMVTLADTLPSDPVMDAEAMAISDSGLIAGYRTTRDRSSTLATVWTDATHFISINGTQIQNSSAADINDAGLVVGRVGSGRQAWQVYPPFSSPVYIPFPEHCLWAEAGGSSATGTNRWGGVVGHQTCRPPGAGWITHAYHWNTVSTFATDLGVYPGAVETTAADVNDETFTVGRAIQHVPPSDPAGYLAYAGFIHHRDFGMVALPRLPSTTGYAQCGADALNNINANGLVQVVGYCTTPSGPGFIRAVRWDVTLWRRSTRPPGPTP
jgi:probable HAF family extracellular repeat protein